jgi:ATP-dependent RNA helicase DDX27
MTLEEDKEFGDSGGLKAAIRSAKRSGRPSKINVPATGRTSSSSSDPRVKKGKVTAGTKSAFERDFNGQGRKPKARTKGHGKRNDR